MEPFRQLLLAVLLLVAMNAKGQLLDTLIDVKPYKLHFKILKGKHSPILFESGGGLDASQWDSIATAVHQQLQATVITYDRAGFGRSSIDTTNYNIIQEIKSLESALKSFGYHDANFLLVGHSLGGFYNRVFAARHPKQVKGIIFLDPRIPSYEDRKFARNYFKTLSRKDFEPDYVSLYYLLANMESTSEYVGQVPLSSIIPVLNIMAETGPFTEEAENNRFKADQRNMVNASKNRTLLFAKGSSHNIPYDKPDLVIEQIIDFYGRLLMKN
ncbi:alpha/beta fold hydrolase [Telluribacter humicola]|uniref:alpha/beta fold hydrolase n=1 Tax=Telluribacter humicola TaxID=1720261 RepID=UPI001A95CE9D|nr:alpha/beta hydrolase [Telluribacter humicola]